MKVGFTYDLRDDYLKEGYGEEETAEFDAPVTIDGIEAALRGLGHEVVRIGHVRALAARLVAGERWDLVFNIAEGLRGLGREAQVPALLDAWGIPYTFSDPLVLALTLHKGLTKRVIRDCGLATADFAVVESAADLAAIDLPYPLFAKPVAEGTGKGIGAASRIGDRARLAAVCTDLLERYRQPVLVETYLSGREFTVGIAGTGAEAAVLGIMEIALRPGAREANYGYDTKERSEELVDYHLADDAEAQAAGALALASYRALGCRDAGRVDVRSDATGRPHFIEVNPLAGLNPVHSDLPMLCGYAGIGYQDLIGRIVDSAARRTGAG